MDKQSYKGKISIVIPAHNEEKVIAKLLDSLKEGVNLKIFQIIVVCNGCEDGTDRVVKGYNCVTCIETNMRGKANALNLGDKEAKYFPRFYVDADIVIDTNSIIKLRDYLETNENDYFAVSPMPSFNYEKSSWLVRCYYDVWTKLPYLKQGLIGAGVYALSQKGRESFSEFQDILNDDGYVRALIDPSKRTSLESSISYVNAPRDVKNMILIKTRSRMGNKQLKERFPKLNYNGPKTYLSGLVNLLRSPLLYHKIPLYLWLNLYIRYKVVRILRKKGYSKEWQRDESTR
jgi:glycosyltransferase involved in cell wall biosynthesis